MREPAKGFGVQGRTRQCPSMRAMKHEHLPVPGSRRTIVVHGNDALDEVHLLHQARRQWKRGTCAAPLWIAVGTSERTPDDQTSSRTARAGGRWRSVGPTRWALVPQYVLTAPGLRRQNPNTADTAHRH